MSTTGTPQHRAVGAYRARLASRGLTRFEVIGREQDRTLIREVARRLSKDDAGAARLRTVVQSELGGPEPSRGRIAAALRRAPRVGPEFNTDRPVIDGRPVEL